MRVGSRAPVGGLGGGFFWIVLVGSEKRGGESGLSLPSLLSCYAPGYIGENIPSLEGLFEIFLCSAQHLFSTCTLKLVLHLALLSFTLLCL